MLLASSHAANAVATTLGDGDLFKWGVVGALMALTAVQGLPLAEKLAKNELDWQPSLRGFLGVVAFITFFLALGGGVAVLVGGATEPKHAIFYGLGWQAILSGYIKGGPRPTDPPQPGPAPAPAPTV